MPFNASRIPSHAAASATVLCISLCLTGSALAQKGKKPGGGGNGETPQPLYAVSLFSHPENGYMFSDLQPFINEALQVAGSFYLAREDGSSYTGPFFYDPLIHSGQAIDLNGVVQGLPEGFTIGQVRDMNDQGMIAVTIRPLTNVHPTILLPSDPGFLELAGLVDTTDGYRFHALPDLGSNRVHPRGINNSNDVVLVNYGNGFETHLATVNPTGGDWEITVDVPGILGTGISERHENGDLFVVGQVTDGDGNSFATRLNLGNPGSGEIALSPVQVAKDKTYHFEAPRNVGVNGWGDFVGSLRSVTERTRRGETTTNTFRKSYLCVDTWEENLAYWPRSLNDNLDFLAGGVSDAPSVLVHRDLAEPIDLTAAIDKATAPEIEWSNPDLRLSCFDLTNRVVSDDGDASNDLPIIVGIEKYRLENIFLLDARHAFILTPIQP